MIFLTVGTLFSFDRLTKAVDAVIGQGLITDTVFAQIGMNAWQPHNMEWVAELHKESYDAKLKQADALISHAGIGSITMALSHNKPLLVMPRMKKYGEHVNDHQLGTANKFEQLGHLLAAYETEELSEKIGQLKTFVPRKRHAQPQTVAKRIAQFLSEISIDS